MTTAIVIVGGVMSMAGAVFMAWVSIYMVRLMIKNARERRKKK